MRKFLFPGLVGLLLVILAACGSSATVAPEAKQAPAAPAAAAQPAAPAAAAQPAAPAAAAKPAAPAAAAPSALAKYAAEHANKPGAIYVGDISQLVGPAPTKDQGDFDGNVPLDSLLRHRYVYESDFYKGLLEKAKLTNPTPLVSTGQSFTIQHACINRTLLPCKLTDSYMFPNVLARTNGQVKLVTSSFPELGLSGTDNHKLVADGTLAMSDIVGPFVAGDIPALEIQYLFGAFTSRQDQFVTTAAISPDIEKLLVEQTGGGKHIVRNWYSGNDFFFFTKKPLRTVADFKGLKTRAFGPAISDWIIGMGAEAQFVAFAETYTALERGILGAGVTGGDAAYGQRWYEVTKYVNGPLISWPATDNVMNKKVWDKLPADLQAIIIEEGAKSELEALRLGAVQNEVGLLKNTKLGGMEYLEFSPELRARSDAAVVERVIPNWAKRTGGPNAPFVKIFNEKVGPVIGFRVEPDGSAVRIGGPKAPAAAAAVAAPASPLAAYAAQYAGKPGAIYVGDIGQLVGPAPTKDQGDFDGNVPLDSVLRHKYVYESEYYKGLLAKAKLTNPTPLVSTGQNITIQHACVNRTLLFCKLSDTFFFPNVLKRTNGQLKLVTSSLPELGIAGPDSLKLVKDGTVAMITIVGPFVAGDLPALEIQYLFGAFTTREDQFKTTAAIAPDIVKLLEDATGGGKVIYKEWASGNDIVFFTKKPLRTAADFKGLKTRAFGTAIADWIEGMGASSQFVPFAEVYTALERGILGAGVSGADAGFGQRWYEVTDYVNGSLVSWPALDMVMNKKVWDKLPPDLQAIMIEEGAKAEMELLRLGSVQNEVGVERNTRVGMEYLEFSPELRALSDKTVIERIIPNWAKRTGGPNSPFVKIFNEKVGPVIGFRVEPDGSAVKVPKVAAK